MTIDPKLLICIREAIRAKNVAKLAAMLAEMEAA